VVDGKLDEWKTVATADVDTRTKAALWFANGKIYGSYRTNDPTLLDNVAADPRYLFKFGGAIDLFFVAKWDPGRVSENNPYQEGDCRVLIAKIKGKPTAVLYRPLAPSASKSEECIFVSPIGREVFQSVTEITDGLESAEDCKGNFEFLLPMDRVLRHKESDKPWGSVNDHNLGIQDWHHDKTVILGDVGYIRGNGGQNVQRACWNSLDTWMTSDIPTEARWRSINWGVLKLVRP